MMWTEWCGKSGKNERLDGFTHTLKERLNMSRGCEGSGVGKKEKVEGYTAGYDNNKGCLMCK